MHPGLHVFSSSISSRLFLIRDEVGVPLSPLGADGFLMISREKEFSETWAGEGVIFICVELNSQVPKVPFPSAQSREKWSWGFSRARGEASVQSFLPMLKVSLVPHQASCSPSVHRTCVCQAGWEGGVPRGRGPHGEGQETKHEP